MFNKLFNAWKVESTWFRIEEIVQLSLQVHVIIERNTTQCIREGLEQIEQIDEGAKSREYRGCGSTSQPRV